MNRINWAQVAVFGIVALLVLLLGTSLLSFGWGGGGMMGPGMMGGWGGMMGPGMMGGWGGMMGGWPSSVGGGGWGVLGWLFPLIGLLIPLSFLALLVLGSVWLFRQVNGRPQGPATGRTQTATGETCPSGMRNAER